MFTTESVANICRFLGYDYKSTQGNCISFGVWQLIVEYDKLIPVVNGVPRIPCTLICEELFNYVEAILFLEGPGQAELIIIL